MLKRCLRYFACLDKARQHEARFVASFISAVRTNVDEEYCGHSMVFYWPKFLDAQLGCVTSIPSLYATFHSVIDNDLGDSARIAASGIA